MRSFVLITVAACTPKPAGTDVCIGYPAQSESAYVLPFAAGKSYRVSQGNCSQPGDGHRDSERYAYDFAMPAGTPFVAMRSGEVLHVETSHRDGQIAPKGFDNYIVVRHDDGTHALYAHLTHAGASCQTGDRVAEGQALGLSGNTGNTNGVAHLHVAMHVCDPVANGSEDCPTWPLTFKNTTPHPHGLERGRVYLAR